MKKKGSLDFYLIVVTVAVLFVISAICVYGMFYFKLAQIQQLAPAEKLAYMDRMNRVVAPFIISLIVLLGICVPKRLLPTVWLTRFALVLAVASGGISLWLGVKTGLVAVLAASLLLQLVVLFLALAGSDVLYFEKSGYWVRLGSSLIHLGIILFVFDLFFHRHQSLHLILFWITTGATVLGMVFCFYSQGVVRLIRGIRGG
ncbi:MAG: hypothetical protein HY885_00130 [Deltaproteobacteria bacterium]|nr:hypothetical protein [Deltaproteobacteria bacterium]